MTPTAWRALFDEAYPEPGVPAHLLADDALERWLSAPLSPDELAEVRGRQENPFPESDPMHAVWQPTDPAGWAMPARSLPPSYRAFLAWSNGGLFVAGDREYQMLKVQELREYLLLYDLPHDMPGAVPFALDGAGGIYLFDARQPASADGEYPVLHVAGDAATHADAARLAGTLPELLRQRTAPRG